MPSKEQIRNSIDQKIDQKIELTDTLSGKVELKDRKLRRDTEVFDRYLETLVKQYKEAGLNIKFDVSKPDGTSQKTKGIPR